MARKRIAKATPEQKQKLKTLKKLHVTKVDLRKPFTRYRARLISKFEPVLQGRAALVKLPKMKTRERSQLIGELASEFPLMLMKSNGQLISKIGHKGEKVIYNKKQNRIQSKFSFDDQPKLATWYPKQDGLPELQQGESYALPFWRGSNRPIFYKFETDLQAVLEMAAKYQDKSERPYENAADYIMIVDQYPMSKTFRDYRREDNRAFSKALRAKPKKLRKRKRKPNNVIPFKPREG